MAGSDLGVRGSTIFANFNEVSANIGVAGLLAFAAPVQRDFI